MEYAIWGKPPQHENETLLCAMPHGKPITERAAAEKIKAELESVHGCTDCRIQTIDGDIPDFAATLNK